MNTPRIKFGKAIETLLWIAALAVLVENVSLFRQNRSLQEAVAPQIAAGTQLQMLSGLTLDGRIAPAARGSAFNQDSLKEKTP